jgi:hypothetical protein
MVTSQQCSTGNDLRDLYTDALAAFHKSQDPILAGVMPGHPNYHEVSEAREQAYSNMLKARRLYWEHIEEHGCQAHNIGEQDAN